MSGEMEQEKYWRWLCSVKGIYENQIADIIRYYKTPEKFYKEFRRGNLKESGWKNLFSGKILLDPQETETEQKEKGIHFVSLYHPSYPSMLKNIPKPPFGLFYMGRLPKREDSVGVVGARRCSGYGRMTAEMIGKGLAIEKVDVISGMASGIDGIAQRAALKAGGRSFAVLGCGVDICYPWENRDLYELLQIQGGIMSEYPPGSQPLPLHFPRRNRIISGLSKTVLVVEAKKKSGSLITVDFALEQGRDVFAVPGRIGESLSEGCNYLIAQGAGIFTSLESILSDTFLYSKEVENNKKNKIVLETVEKLVYSCLDFKSISLEAILTETKLAVPEVMKALVDLKIKGFIGEDTKNYYKKIR